MNKYKLLIISVVYLFILNIVFSLLLYNYINLSNFFFYLLESISVSTIIVFISELFKGKLKKIVNILFLVIISIFYVGQYVHYHFYECFFSIYSFVHGGQVFAFVPAIIKIICTNIGGFLVLISFIFIIIVVLSMVKYSDKSYSKKVLCLIFIINLLVTTFFIYVFDSNNIYSRKSLLNSTNTETRNVQSFGLVTAMSIDLQRFIFNPKYEFFIDKNKNNYDKDNYNVLDIDFNINSNDKDLKELNSYLKTVKPTNKNKYTGIFKNKNLIFITAESFSFSAIDKELTSTLYMLTNNGFSFTNFYTPIYYASTSDGEYTNLTGLLPREGRWSYIDIKNNYFPYSYASVLKKDNYDLFGYHNGVYTFYDRNEVMPRMGYTFKGCGNGLEKYINCNLWPQSDDEMISKTFGDYKDSSKFHAYYMSISGHLNHDFKNNDMAKKHKDYVKDLNYSNSVKAYLSATIDLDKALEHLINNLKKDNKLDDTVIVLAPDHFPYGLSKKEYSELKSTYNTYDKHKSGLIIYNPLVKSTKIDKYASNIDVLPTLLNMFEIDYDSRLIIGNDIMSDSEGIVMFNDRSFLTEYGFYNEKNNTFTKFKKIDDNYINSKRKEVFNKYNASGLILEKNYYKYIK